jgi:hypothetical protein
VGNSSAHAASVAPSWMWIRMGLAVFPTTRPAMSNFCAEFNTGLKRA